MEALASHLVGIGRDLSNAQIDHLRQQILDWPKPVSRRSCPQGYGCSSGQFLRALHGISPIVATFSTASYSNLAFEICGIALERKMGKSFSEVIQDGLVDRLGSNATTYGLPGDDVTSIVQINKTASVWEPDLKIFNAAGGYFPTVNDMAVIGRSLMKSTYLNPSQTRRWLRPHSFMSQSQGAVGSPWEIFQTSVSKGNN